VITIRIIKYKMINSSSTSNTAFCSFVSLRMKVLIPLLLLILAGTSCVRYSFTGTSIPENVNSVFIPFFADQSSSGIGDLSDRLNQIIINRFINQTRLRSANSRGEADAILEGSIVSYQNRPFSITGDEEADQNEVTITVRATYQYTSEEKPEWTNSYTGKATYDPNEDPIEGETNAAEEAIRQITNNMFNDAVSGW
jgi:hypothetical protein